jgi:hypothetical protein
MITLQQFPIYQVQVRDVSGLLNLITFLSPDEIGDIPSQAIVGKLIGPGTDLVPENFCRNRSFVDFMHRVIQRVASQIDDFVTAARQLGTGWLDIRDARAFAADPKVAATDIIGSFRVASGVIVPEDYVPNPEHWILSRYGIFTPHPEIQNQLLAAMRELGVKEVAVE